MKLHDLGYEGKDRKKKKKLGRGPASGKGKTSGKGHKGQNARSGGGVRPGFEGGQTPLYRRIPKRGFTNIHKKEYIIINISELNKYPENTMVTIDNFVKNNNKKNEKLKILGNADLKIKLHVKANKFTKKAKELIEKAGGTVEEIS